MADLKQRGALPFHATPKADEGRAWDGAAEVAQASPEDLHAMCAWVDSMQPAEDKSAYKLPHHLAESGHPVVWKGVVAAMEALLGARGGVEIPAQDAHGVYLHLAGHYRQFGQEPPPFHRAAKLEAHFRIGSVEFRAAGEGDKRTYEMTFSSEAEADPMGPGYPGGPSREILSHDQGAMDLSLMPHGVPLFMDHGMRGERRQIGFARNLRIDAVARKGRADVRFSRTQLGQDSEMDAVDGNLPYASFGYDVLRAKLEKVAPDGVRIWRAMSWSPFEISLLTMPPADTGVGFERSANRESREAILEEEVTVPALDAETKPAGTPPARKEAKRMKRVREDGGAIIEVEDSDPRPAILEDARSQEQKDRDADHAESFRMCEANNCSGHFAEWMEKGYTAAQVAHEIIKLRATPRPSTPPPAAELKGLRQSERANYSYARAINLAAGMHMRGAKFDGLEARVHEELMSEGYKAPNGGVLVPMDLRSSDQQWRDGLHKMRAGLDSKTLTKGAETVFDQGGQLIELLRNFSASASLGALTLTGLSAPIGFPRQNAAAAVTWVGENPAADVTQSDAGLGLVTLQPKTLQGTTAYSRQLLQTASIDVESMVRNDFAKQHGLAIDKAVYHGKGTDGQPIGLYLLNDTNSAVGTQDMSSTVPTFALLMAMVGKVATANALVGNSIGWVTTPGMAAKLATVPIASNTAVMIWTGGLDVGGTGQMCGYRAYSTAQISSTMTGSAGAETGGNDHGILFGNWADCKIGLFGAMEVVVDPYALKKRGMIEVTSFQLADIIFQHGASFCISTTARTA